MATLCGRYNNWWEVVLHCLLVTPSIPLNTNKVGECEKPAIACVPSLHFLFLSWPTTQPACFSCLSLKVLLLWQERAAACLFSFLQNLFYGWQILFGSSWADKYNSFICRCDSCSLWSRACYSKSQKFLLLRMVELWTYSSSLTPCKGFLLLE